MTLVPKTALANQLQNILPMMKVKRFVLCIGGASGSGKETLIRAALRHRRLIVEPRDARTFSQISLLLDDQVLWISQAEFLEPPQQRMLLELMQRARRPALIISFNDALLERGVQERTYSKKLAERLQALQFRVSSLQEVSNDIPHYAQHFLALANQKYDKEILSIHEHALHALTMYHYPGNLEELRLVIEHAVLLETTEILMPDSIVMPGDVVQSVSTAQAYAAYKKEVLSQADAVYVSALLREYGSVTRSARAAGVLRPAFSRLMRRCGISLEGEVRAHR